MRKRACWLVATILLLVGSKGIAEETKEEITMEKKEVVKAYFQGLEGKNYEGIIRLFAEDAVVHSPLYGKIEAVKFYRDLFQVTQSSQITLKNIFLSATDPDCAAAHFIYAWKMKNGALCQFECVDVFEFRPNSSKIRSLTIIYDTARTRKDFEKLHE
jgi:hypothetical protein